MYRITEKKDLTPTIKLMRVDAPAVARKAQAGQFIILRLHDRAERIPLTIADYSREQGTITIVFQMVGKSTEELATSKTGEKHPELCGATGRALGDRGLRERWSASEEGSASPPSIRSPGLLRRPATRIISIIGAKSDDLLFFESEMNSVSDEFQIVTDDGSRGKKGLVTDALGEILQSGVHDRPGHCHRSRAHDACGCRTDQNIWD